MTILAALAVSPLGQKPYVIMGSESRIISGITFDKRENKIISVDNINDNFRKVFKPLSNVLFGMAGWIADDIMQTTLTFIKENIKDNEDLEHISEKILNFVINNVSFSSDISSKLDVIIAGYIGGNAAFSNFMLDFEMTNNQIYYRIPEPNNVIPICKGNTIFEEDVERLMKRLGGNELNNITAARGALTEFIKDSANRHPMTCNQKVVIERLR